MLLLQRFKPLAGHIRWEEASANGELRCSITWNSDIHSFPCVDGPIMMVFCPTARKGSRWLLCGRPRTQTHLPLHKDALQLCTAHCWVCHRHSGKSTTPYLLYMTWNWLVKTHSDSLISVVCSMCAVLGVSGTAIDLCWDGHLSF